MHGSFRRLLYTVAACATLRECQGGVDSSGKPPPPEGVPDRSLTFESYFNDPSFRPHIPVYTSEVDVVSYVPDKIVSLWDRVALPASHDKVRHLRTYKRPRQIEDVWGEGWDELTGEAAGLFELSLQQGRMVLLVNMSSAHELYAPLGATGRVNHYDPVAQDGIAPFSTDVGVERQEAAYREEAAQQAARRAEGEHAAEEEEQAMRAKLPPLLGLKSVSPSSLVDVDYASLVSGLGRHPVLFSSQLILDFSLLLEVSGTKNGVPVTVVRRLDLTLVPRVPRDRPTSTLCMPGKDEVVSPGLRGGLPFEQRSALAFNMLPGPESAACQRHGRRGDLETDSGCARASLMDDEEIHALNGRPVRKVARVSSAAFVNLHPEEAFWLEYRLDRTSEHIAKFVEEKLGRRLEASDARLAVAVAHGGEGKRGAIHSMGVASALWQLGVYQGATWVGASSGAAWFLAAWYAQAKASKLFTAPPDLSATRNVEYTRTLGRSAFPDEFDPREAVTDVFIPASPKTTDSPTKADRVLCDAELKLNAYHALEGLQGTPSLFEYLTRAMAMQFLDPISQDAMAFTLSGLAKNSFLQKTAAPLPVFQVREEVEGEEWGGRLWSLTPFDMGVMRHGDLHASFPTERLDSNVTSSSQLVTQFQDTLPYIAGLASNPLPGLRRFDWARGLCGEGSQDGCRPVRLHNPFKKFEALRGNTADPSLYERDYVTVAGGGGLQGLPVWPFVNPARRADILILSDASGGRREGPVSRDTTLPRRSTSFTGAKSKPLPRRRAVSGKTSGRPDMQGHGEGKLECIADSLGRDCPGPQEGVDSTLPGTLCCDYCKGPEAEDLGCWPSDDPDTHPLFGLVGYSDRHALPTLPTTREQVLPLLEVVSIFGCDSVSSRTAIVYIPNRVVTSGAGGHPPLKGVVGYGLPGLREQRYGPKEVKNIYENGARSLPNAPDLPPLDKCLACLYYATAMGDDAFMRTDPECSGCWDAYCYQE